MQAWVLRVVKKTAGFQAKLSFRSGIRVCFIVERALRMSLRRWSDWSRLMRGVASRKGSRSLEVSGAG